jgi:hypothetical protein
MSNADIKMSDVFDLPIFNNSHTYESGESISIISDNYCNEIVSSDADLTKKEADYVCEAVNSHDALIEQNKALIEALEHIKKHQETVVVGMPQLSATWQIAARALERL